MGVKGFIDGKEKPSSWGDEGFFLWHLFLLVLVIDSDCPRLRHRFFSHHRDTEGTEANLVLPDRETTIGQKNPALGAVFTQAKAASRSVLQSPKALAAGDGFFPWPPPARHASKARRAGLPAREKTKPSVTSVPLW